MGGGHVRRIASPSTRVPGLGFVQETEGIAEEGGKIAVSKTAGMLEERREGRKR